MGHFTHTHPSTFTGASPSIHTPSPKICQPLTPLCPRVKANGFSNDELADRSMQAAQSLCTRAPTALSYLRRRDLPIERLTDTLHHHATVNNG